MKPDETQNRMQSEMTNEAGILPEVRSLRVGLTARKKTLATADGMSMNIRSGKIVGVVGESGSGRSVTSQSIPHLREYDSDVRYEGQVLFEGQDLLKALQAEVHGARSNRVTVILQNLMTLLSSVHTVGGQLLEVLVLHKKVMKQRAKERCGELLHLAGIPNPESCTRKYPYELPGGMQQRVMIAMALSYESRLLIADEPTTVLDIAIQKQILDLITESNGRVGMPVLFITHDSGIMARICHSVRVMYPGNLMEEARTEELLVRPIYPCTQGLLDCIPHLDLNCSQSLHVISDVMPPLSDVLDGYRFCTRCPYADQRCMSQNLPLAEMLPGHKARCRKYTSEQEAEQSENTTFGGRGPSEELPGLWLPERTISSQNIHESGTQYVP